MIVRVLITINSAIFIEGMLLLYAAGSKGETRAVTMDSPNTSIKNNGSQYFHHNILLLNGLNEDGDEEHELRKPYNDIAELAQLEEVTHEVSSFFIRSSFAGSSTSMESQLSSTCAKLAFEAQRE